MNHQSIYIFQWIKHVPNKKICWKFWNVQLLRLCWNQVSACGAFDVLIRFFFLRLTKDQVSYAVNDRHLRTLMLNDTSIIKGLKCSQESNGFFSFSDYFFSYMVIVVSLITSVIHLCGCDLVGSLVKQNCLKLESEWRQERCTCPLIMA